MRRDRYGGSHDVCGTNQGFFFAVRNRSRDKANACFVFLRGEKHEKGGGESHEILEQKSKKKRKKTAMQENEGAKAPAFAAAAPQQQQKQQQQNRPPPRLIISEMVLENFKSYAGQQRVGPFHKVCFFCFFFRRVCCSASSFFFLIVTRTTTTTSVPSLFREDEIIFFCASPREAEDTGRLSPSVRRMSKKKQ